MKNLYPIAYKGRFLDENDCDPLFTAYYTCFEALSPDMSVRVDSSTVVYPLQESNLQTIVEIADDYHDGHFSIHKFTTGYKGHFTTISENVRSYLDALPLFEWLEDLYTWMIIQHNNDIDWYDADWKKLKFSKTGDEE